ncbi:hypothetical protein [Shimia biformata]|uniref:hypothetical protein n=1 Tax=Shimia biformata TaxID=1294299 RepID=UPI0019504CB8|nr:hypothetical protein [Shimia biformata]
MTKGLCVALVALMLLPAAPVAVQAGLMDKACLKSDRRQKSRPLCNCIQQVANQTLSVKDQRIAATFFNDPHRSQEIRQSDNRAHEKFWLRYKDFGGIAAASCGHLVK